MACMRAKIGSKGVLGVILAGGAGQRLGGAVKPLLPLQAGTVLDYITPRAQRQVACLALSLHFLPAGNDDSPFAAFPGPVLADPPQFLRADDRAGRAGPLAGVAAALAWARQEKAQWLALFPGDTPFFPTDYVVRLMSVARRGGAPAAYAVSAGRMHPTSSLWSVAMADMLWNAVNAGERRVGRWLMEQGAVAVDWPVCPNGRDPFFNINEPKDLEHARAWVHNQPD